MIHIHGSDFKDELGRTLLLRGVNLSGSSKVPFSPNGASHLKQTFLNHRELTFTGRPFPLHEADEHFRRLKSWGMLFLRFLITWEAIEHAGPGEYDQEYLDYLRAVIQKAGQHGIQVFIDPHQDVWSRFTGGDGAPGWTLEALGMQLSRLDETGAAIVHCLRGDPFPRMIWPSNYDKFAAATLFSLFFGGSDFAPARKIEGIPVQEYLQSHYINAVKQAAARLADLPNVAGYDTLNEPSGGWIGRRALDRAEVLMYQGEVASPLQAMALADGIPQRLPVWEQGIPRRRVVEERLVNPRGLRLWRDGVEDVWREAGVWQPGADGQPILLRPAHFYVVDGREVDFCRDYMRPFINRFAAEIRSVHPNALVFMEVPVELKLPQWGEGDAADIVNATHWYDNVTLFMKDFYGWFSADVHTGKLVIGPSAVRALFRRQIAAIKAQSETRLGGTPTLIGEFGIPMDMHNRAGYKRGDFSRHERALDASYQALEASLVSSTLWNYTADNTNERGDLWNGEDLSLFSRDQQTDPADINSGGRALRAAVRPYPIATAGRPLKLRFSYRDRRFEYEFEHDPAVQAETEIYLPALHYGGGCQVSVSDGEFELRPADQRLIYRHSDRRKTHKIRVRPA